MDSEKVVCEIFGEKDTGAIAKTRLITAVAKQSKLIKDLILELFCENPYNNFFRQYSEQEVVPMRLERIRRIDAGSKQGVVKQFSISRRNHG